MALFGLGKKRNLSEIYKVIEAVNGDFAGEFSYAQAQEWSKITADLDRLDVAEYKKSNVKADLERSIVAAYKARLRGIRNNAAFLSEVRRIVNETKMVVFPDDLHEDEKILMRLIKDMQTGKFGNPKLAQDANLMEALNTLLEEIGLAYEEKKVKKEALSQEDRNTLNTLLSGNDVDRAIKYVRELAQGIHTGTYVTKPGKGATGGITVETTADAVNSSRVIRSKFDELDSMIASRVKQRDLLQGEVEEINRLIAENDAKMDEIAMDDSRAWEYDEYYNQNEDLMGQKNWKVATISDCNNIKSSLELLKTVINRSLNADSSAENIKRLEKELGAVDLKNSTAVQKLTEVISSRIKAVQHSSNVAPVRAEDRRNITPATAGMSSAAQADRLRRLEEQRKRQEMQSKIDNMGVGMDANATEDPSSKETY